MLTPNLKKAELSYAYIHAVCSYAGFSCEKTAVDMDSIDVRVAAKGKLTPQSLTESCMLELQLKATVAIAEHDAKNFSYPLPMKNYDDLRKTTQVPRYLVVYDLHEDEGMWLKTSKKNLVKRKCVYWHSLKGEHAVANESSKTIYIPKRNLFNVQGLKTLMEHSSEMRHLP